MKRLISLLIFAMTFITSFAEWNVGLLNNRLPFIGFDSSRGYNFRLYQSIYSEKISHQYMRLEGGFTYDAKIFDLEGTLLAGTAYNRSYTNTSLQLSILCRPCNILGVKATIAPWWDSSLHYTTCYNLETTANISSEIALCASLSNIPEYRLAEKRLKIGALFHVKNLTVNPLLSIDLTSGRVAKNFRPIVNFTYTFAR